MEISGGHGDTAGVTETYVASQTSVNVLMYEQDDPLNPYVPRARGRMLGPPTSTRIRLLKSANFVQHDLNTSKHMSISNTPNASAVLPTVINSGPTEMNLNLTRLSEVGQVDRGSEKRHSTRSAEASTPQRSSKRLSKYDMPTNMDGAYRMRTIPESQSSYTFSSAPLQSSDKPILPKAKRYEQSVEDIISDSPRKSMPAPYRKHEFPFGLNSPRRKTCLEAQGAIIGRGEFIHPQGVIPLTSESPGKGPNEGPLVRPLWPGENSAMQSIDGAAEKTLICSRPVKTEENRFSLPSELSVSEVEVTPCKRRALHRQARMIDGAIFHPRTRKGTTIESEIRGDGSPVKLASEKAMNRLSSQSAQTTSTTGSRADWLHNVLNRFRKHKSGKQQTKLQKQHSNLAGCTRATHANCQSSVERQSIATEVANMSRSPVPRTISGFNGVNEYNNKPLPLSPAEERRRSMASETRRFFQQGSESGKISFEYPTISIREENDIPSLVSATMTGPNELSPHEKKWKHYSLTSSDNGPSS